MQINQHSFQNEIAASNVKPILSPFFNYFHVKESPATRLIGLHTYQLPPSIARELQDTIKRSRASYTSHQVWHVHKMFDSPLTAIDIQLLKRDKAASLIPMREEYRLFLLFLKRSDCSFNAAHPTLCHVEVWIL